MNLYAFCRNNGVNGWDYLGMGFDEFGIRYTDPQGNFSGGVNPWFSNSFGVVSGGSMIAAGSVMLGTPAAPAGVFLVLQGGSQFVISVGNLHALSNGAASSDLPDNSGVFSLVNASVNGMSGAQPDKDATVFKWIDYGSTIAVTGVPGIEKTNWLDVHTPGIPKSVDTTIGAVGTVLPLVTPPPSDGVKPADSKIYPTSKAAAAGGGARAPNSFNVPNTSSGSGNSFSDAFNRGLNNSNFPIGSNNGTGSAPGNGMDPGTALQLAPFVVNGSQSSSSSSGGGGGKSLWQQIVDLF